MLQRAVMRVFTAISAANGPHLLPAFNQQWRQDRQPIWGVAAATGTFVGKGYRCYGTVNYSP